MQRNTAARLERAPSIAPASRARPVGRQPERTTNGLVTNGLSNRASVSSSPKPNAAESELQDEIAKLRVQVEQVRLHFELDFLALTDS